jgi:hypothetical protein
VLLFDLQIPFDAANEREYAAQASKIHRKEKQQSMLIFSYHLINLSKNKKMQLNSLEAVRVKFKLFNFFQSLSIKKSFSFALNKQFTKPSSRKN